MQVLLDTDTHTVTPQGPVQYEALCAFVDSLVDKLGWPADAVTINAPTLDSLVLPLLQESPYTWYCHSTAAPFVPQPPATA